MQAINNDMTNAQTRVQEELQRFNLQPTDKEQIMQIVVLVIMFVGAVWYFTWSVKPFLFQYAQVQLLSVAMPVLCVAVAFATHSDPCV